MAHIDISINGVTTRGICPCYLHHKTFCGKFRNKGCLDQSQSSTICQQVFSAPMHTVCDSTYSYSLHDSTASHLKNEFSKTLTAQQQHGHSVVIIILQKLKVLAWTHSYLSTAFLKIICGLENIFSSIKKLFYFLIYWCIDKAIHLQSIGHELELRSHHYDFKDWVIISCFSVTIWLK